MNATGMVNDELNSAIGLHFTIHWQSPFVAFVALIIWHGQLGRRNPVLVNV
jgi:hypothetical protein